VPGACRPVGVPRRGTGDDDDDDDDCRFVKRITQDASTALQGAGGGAPPQVTPSGGDTQIPRMKVKNVAEFYKGYWRNDHLEGRERVGVVTTTK